MSAPGVPAEIVLVPGTHMSSIAGLHEPDDAGFAAILEFLEARW